MAMGSGLLALAMVAADGPSCPPVETTTYQVRVLTMDGLDWRTSSYTRLQPVAHQGTSTIWTADRALAASLADRAKGTSPCHTITAVGEAVMTKADSVNYVAAMDRVADGPINQSSAIAFVPRPERIEEKFAIRVAGRKLDQGVLTKLAIEETHVDVIHGVAQTETLVPVASKTPKNPDGPPSETKTAITSSVQVPEISQASVAGEWLIPDDGVLIVSLGVKTAADDQGKAVVRERIAVVEAFSNTASPEGRRPTTVPMTSPVHAASFEHVKLGTPVVPGRTLPQAVDPGGNVLELPPLPEALASADLDQIKPEPYQPSPQTRIHSSPASMADPALARTSYDVAPAAPMAPTVGEGGIGADVNVEMTDIIDALLKAEKKGDLGKILLALLKAGVMIDKVPDLGATDFVPARAEAAPNVCPANAGSIKGASVAGGISIVREGKPRMEIIVKDASGMPVLDGAADLIEALRVPGKTETALIPLGGQLSLEVKATVVPAGPEKAKTATKTEGTPVPKR